MNILILLLLAVSGYGYEFVSNDALVKDVRDAITAQDLDKPVTWFIRDNIGKVPVVDPKSGPSGNIPSLLGYFDVVNQSYQTAASLATTSKIHHQIHPIYVITALDSMARLQGDLKAFIDAFPRSDPTYPVRVAGLQKMNNGVVSVITSIGIMIGDGSLPDDSKVYLLKNALSIIPRFKGYISKEVMVTPRELFDRYRVDDQKPEIQDLFMKVRAQLDDW